MNSLDKLRRVINKRPVIIMLHGKSIEGLEKNIQKFGKFDICYTSLNYFDLLEDNILTKIGKKLSFVFDSAGVVPDRLQEYETKWRIPRLSKFLDRKENNLWLTTKGSMRMSLINTGSEEFIIKYRDKTILVDDFNIRLNVPNSAVLLIGLAIIGEASKIAICGLDGWKGAYQDNLSSFYKQDLYVKHRTAATGDPNYTGLVQDTNNFEIQTKKILSEYCKQYKIKMPPIINVSIESVYSIFPRFTYEGLYDWMKLKVDGEK